MNYSSLFEIEILQEFKDAKKKFNNLFTYLCI